MTSTIVYMLSCDHAGCDRTAPKDDSDGWTDAIYTHGCPEHGGQVEAHRAVLTNRTTGRGSREKTYWYLTCACGWTPRPNGIAHNHGPLKAAHLAHIREQAA